MKIEIKNLLGTGWELYQMGHNKFREREKSDYHAY